MNHHSRFLASVGVATSRVRFLLTPRLVSCTLVLTIVAAPLRGDHPNDNADESAPPTLSWQIESSHPIVSAGDSEFFLRIRVKAAQIETEREPINLSVVFDRSGSMKEESKIGYVQKAGHLVKDNLSRDDYIAFVAYNHGVHVMVPLHKAVNREYLHHRIDELYAEGYTNLSAGLLEGCAQVRKRIDQPGLHHVILLTDGLANRGVIKTDALVNLVGRCTRQGITLTTIGLGTDYNEKLLSRMAQAGGGRYLHVSDPDKIPAAFEQEMGALLDVVAQNTKLTMRLPPGVVVKQVFGREEVLKPDKLEIPLGDMTSGEERVLLLKLSSGPTPGNGPIELPGLLTYDDIVDAHRAENAQSLAVQRAPAGTTVVEKPGPVLAYAQLVEAVDKISMAVQGMDRKLAAQVLDIRLRQYPALKQVAQSSRDQDFYNKAFMFEHYARELQDLVDRGALHAHSAERAKLQKELHYRRYLREHHQHHH